MKFNNKIANFTTTLFYLVIAVKFACCLKICASLLYFYLIIKTLQKHVPV